MLATTMAVPATSATYTLSFSGTVANTQYSSFPAFNRIYDTGRLVLDANDPLPAELVAGDRIEFTVTLDDRFVVPGSGEQFIGLNFEGDTTGTPPSTSGEIEFADPAGIGTGPFGVGCSNCLSALFFNGASGKVSFTGLSGFIEIGNLTDPYQLSQVISLSFQNSNPVPEPASWAMMIAGFAAAGAFARRRTTVESLA
ncbi:PEPxxWA-CTERM sorting domain-containing protein [Sphingomonas sp.]|uniref:PEPxxWA-CTERM sorting domain-containing protein n=1 Tax=Sphingomonas sp. TaxID=28214 RepID=UPI002DF3B460|nr:PEPxxWA-CTERM sorting domain-containing protein [Sphingomonas sp.]